MKTLGIIAEYNPFHNGHLFHLQKSKLETKCDAVVVILSGNFVQRGEPAICDKYLRTKMALINGADLVIELPVYYATGSAQYFASGAISLLHKCGIIDSICFGSENGDINSLKLITKELIDETFLFKTALKEHLSNGNSFPSARNKALIDCIHTSNITKSPNINQENNAILQLPNNILAIEYLKAIDRLSASFEIHTIKREKADYHSKNLVGNIASATAIRNSILNNSIDSIEPFIPYNCLELINSKIKQDSFPYLLDNLSQLFQYIIKTKDIDDIKNINGISEGLENRILIASNNFLNINEIIREVKTKRYTFTRIQRAILSIILDITKADFNTFELLGGPQYIRILGFRKDCGFLLKKLEEKALIPVVTNLKHADKKLSYEGQKMLQKEIQTTDIYYLASKSQNVVCKKNIEYSIPLIII